MFDFEHFPVGPFVELYFREMVPLDVLAVPGRVECRGHGKIASISEFRAQLSQHGSDCYWGLFLPQERWPSTHTGDLFLPVFPRELVAGSQPAMHCWGPEPLRAAEEGVGLV